MKNVLLIDNYDSFTYNLAQILDESSLCKFDIVKNDRVNLHEIYEYDKILISPGPGLPEDSPVLFELLDKYKETASILGICLGMQAIAEYYGAGLYNLNKVYHGITAETKIIDTDDLIFQGLPKRIDTGLYHSWAVMHDRIPEELKVTAVSQEDIIMGISHVVHDVKGIQFHPESVMTKTGRIIIENWLSYQK